MTALVVMLSATCAVLVACVMESAYDPTGKSRPRWLRWPGVVGLWVVLAGLSWLLAVLARP